MLLIGYLVTAILNIPDDEGHDVKKKGAGDFAQKKKIGSLYSLQKFVLLKKILISKLISMQSP